MNLITLVNEYPVTLASGRVVFGPEETGALESAIDAANALALTHASADERINAAIEEGRKQGFNEGFDAGMQEGSKQISEQLVRLTDQSQSHIEQQRGNTTQMALQIVRKITGTLAPQDTLAALAQVAAQECGENETITLRVHPICCDQVRERLSTQTHTDAGSNRVTTVVADASLEQDGCVLETRHGSVIADLETQLIAIQTSLRAVMPDSA